MEMMVDIYEGENVYRTQTDSDTNRQQPLQSTGSELVRIRSYRSVTVCLVLFCVLLLTAVIVLCVLIDTNNQQINNKNLTEENDQLLTKYTNLKEERKQLLTKYTSMTDERDELIAKYNIITEQNEQLNQEKKELRRHFNGGWIYYQSTLYYISSEKKSWDESRRYCRERGADLIIINNGEEHDFFQKMSGTEYVWIGLSDSDEEGRWKWVDGSTLNSNFWHTGDPNGGRKENCALKHSSLWADYPCNDAYKCICEKKFLI
ncbi:CD209 antigen-like protein C [Paramisgurnus dabryanus]|uniref:CD209 antigen-like protein C n=1 Tax=Paramisgurnus dabryanus TaxID=90735 RepID=UPI0031F35640